MVEPPLRTPRAVEMAARPESQPTVGPRPGRGWQRWRWTRLLALPLVVLLVAGLVALAVSQLNLHSVGNTLTSANLGWVALAFFLMGTSLVFRALSWHQTLEAAIPHFSVGFPAILRATVIGVMVSALLPGRMGEPSRSLIVSRRLGSARRYFTLVLGTVFSQTLINVLALVILGAVTFTSVPLFHGREGGLLAAALVPLVVAAIAFGAPRVLRAVGRSRSPRLRRAAEWTSVQLALARRGFTVFARPRHGIPAVAAQLFAWVLQWLACYAVLLALHFDGRATIATAAAILLAVNVSAILPATPSNVGVFQAACLVVLAAFGFGASQSLAYGILLQAVEVITAVAMGVPSLLGEGMSWRELSHMRDLDERTE